MMTNPQLSTTTTFSNILISVFARKTVITFNSVSQTKWFSSTPVKYWYSIIHLNVVPYICRLSYTYQFFIIFFYIYLSRLGFSTFKLRKSYRTLCVFTSYITYCLNLQYFNIFLLFLIFSYYIYQHFSYVSGPHSIHSSNPLNLVFPSWVKRVDAALTWYRNKRLYLFYDGYYWRYNHYYKRFDTGYPKEISRGWRGLPNKIDAGYSLKEHSSTFFISGDLHYKLND